MQNHPLPPLPPGMGPAASAPFTERVLPACNGQLDLRAAYTWNRAQIFDFLAAVIATPAQYGADVADVPELTLILGEIRNLSLPNGPAPPTATKRLFFLPLTAMFGRWVYQLIGMRAFMYNCTWQASPIGPSHFFFGASLAGYNMKPNLVGRWGTVLRQARYRLVAGEFISLNGWSFNYTPALVQDDTKRTKFGNCAETVGPFVHFLRGYGGTNRDVHGISLQWKGTRPATYQDSLRGETWRRVAHPCFNSRELIRIHGGVIIENFDRYSSSGSIGGPP